MEREKAGGWRMVVRRLESRIRPLFSQPYMCVVVLYKGFEVRVD